jgi:hypothetical protein
MDAHQQRKHHAHQYRYKGKKEILQADDLVVSAEDITPHKTLALRLYRYGRTLVHGCFFQSKPLAWEDSDVRGTAEKTDLHSIVGFIIWEFGEEYNRAASGGSYDVQQIKPASAIRFGTAAR